MPSDRELIGLFIAIYVTLTALMAWIVHMIRKTLHQAVHRGSPTAGTGAHR